MMETQSSVEEVTQSCENISSCGKPVDEEAKLRLPVGIDDTRCTVGGDPQAANGATWIDNVTSDLDEIEAAILAASAKKIQDKNNSSNATVQRSSTSDSAAINIPSGSNVACYLDDVESAIQEDSIKKVQNESAGQGEIDNNPSTSSPSDGVPTTKVVTSGCDEICDLGSTIPETSSEKAEIKRRQTDAGDDTIKETYTSDTIDVVPAVKVVTSSSDVTFDLDDVESAIPQDSAEKFQRQNDGGSQVNNYPSTNAPAGDSPATKIEISGSDVTFDVDNVESTIPEDCTGKVQCQHDCQGLLNNCPSTNVPAGSFSATKIETSSSDIAFDADDVESAIPEDSTVKVQCQHDGQDIVNNHPSTNAPVGGFSATKVGTSCSDVTCDMGSTILEVPSSEKTQNEGQKEKLQNHDDGAITNYTNTSDKPDVVPATKVVSPSNDASCYLDHKESAISEDSTVKVQHQGDGNGDSNNKSFINVTADDIPATKVTTTCKDITCDLDDAESTIFKDSAKNKPFLDSLKMTSATAADCLPANGSSRFRNTASDQDPEYTVQEVNRRSSGYAGTNERPSAKEGCYSETVRPKTRRYAKTRFEVENHSCIIWHRIDERPDTPSFLRIATIPDLSGCPKLHTSSQVCPLPSISGYTGQVTVNRAEVGNKSERHSFGLSKREYYGFCRTNLKFSEEDWDEVVADRIALTGAPFLKGQIRNRPKAALRRKPEDLAKIARSKQLANQSRTAAEPLFDPKVPTKQNKPKSMYSSLNRRRRWFSCMCSGEYSVPSPVTIKEEKKSSKIKRSWFCGRSRDRLKVKPLQRQSSPPQPMEIKQNPARNIPPAIFGGPCTSRSQDSQDLESAAGGAGDNPTFESKSEGTLSNRWFSQIKLNPQAIDSSVYPYENTRSQHYEGTTVFGSRFSRVNYLEPKTRAEARTHISKNLATSEKHVETAITNSCPQNLELENQVDEQRNNSKVKKSKNWFRCFRNKKSVYADAKQPNLPAPQKVSEMKRSPTSYSGLVTSDPYLTISGRTIEPPADSSLEDIKEEEEETITFDAIGPKPEILKCTSKTGLPIQRRPSGTSTRRPTLYKLRKSVKSSGAVNATDELLTSKRPPTPLTDEAPEALIRSRNPHKDDPLVQRTLAWAEEKPSRFQRWFVRPLKRALGF